MRKLLVLLIALAIALPVFATVPTVTQSSDGVILRNDYCLIYEVADFDSLTGAVQVDTTNAFPLWIMGNTKPFADKVTLWFDVYSTKAANAALTKADTILFNLQIAGGKLDSTNLTERALSWRPTTMTTSNTDTVLLGPVAGTSLATGSYCTSGFYELSSTQLGECAGARYGRILLVKPQAGATADTFRLVIKMQQSYTGWISQ